MKTIDGTVGGKGSTEGMRTGTEILPSTTVCPDTNLIPDPIVRLEVDQSHRTTLSCSFQGRTNASSKRCRSLNIEIQFSSQRSSCCLDHCAFREKIMRHVSGCRHKFQHVSTSGPDARHELRMHVETSMSKCHLPSLNPFRM